MFGLSRREQYWAEERRAAELLAEITCAALKAQAEVEVAKAQADASELKALRAEVAEMRRLLAARPLPDNAMYRAKPAL